MAQADRRGTGMRITWSGTTKKTALWTLVAMFWVDQAYGLHLRGPAMPNPLTGQTCAIYPGPFPLAFPTAYVTESQCHCFWGAYALAVFGFAVLMLLPVRSKG
ncbi:MAG: hypothetical protein KJS68_06880, partial [Alphaproteobacteria bacterium]|nr:hypothetical protein [Alphaproteobacteria bacterium]